MGTQVCGEVFVQCQNPRCLANETMEIDENGHLIDHSVKFRQEGKNIYCRCGSHELVKVYKF
ncbi:MAG: hypothetical protein HYT20_02590 [Candidatus Nealsonbacteria bacterium]|nr:hypothetical protein [Candidatus Nealsonbacteria bacterium]